MHRAPDGKCSRCNALPHTAATAPLHRRSDVAFDPSRTTQGSQKRGDFAALTDESAGVRSEGHTSLGISQHSLECKILADGI